MYCVDKFDKFNKIDNNNLKIDNYRLLTTYPFIDFYRFSIQLTNFYRFYQLLSITGIIDWTSRVTIRFNPIQQFTAMYNSRIFNGRNTTINDPLTHSKYTEVFFYYPCVRQYFYINHMYSKSFHCNVSKLSVYYKIARSFTLFSLRKCTQLHHFIS